LLPPGFGIDEKTIHVEDDGVELHRRKGSEMCRFFLSPF
jgi:hypothetical protein